MVIACAETAIMKRAVKKAIEKKHFAHIRRGFMKVKEEETEEAEPAKGGCPTVTPRPCEGAQCARRADRSLVAPVWATK